MNHTCPVCGFISLTEPPRGRDGGGSYEICPSCGYQFGVSDDDSGISHEQWRAVWRDAGMQWSSDQAPPSGWDPEMQLAKLTANPGHRKTKG